MCVKRLMHAASGSKYVYFLVFILFLFTALYSFILNKLIYPGQGHSGLRTYPKNAGPRWQYTLNYPGAP